MVSESLPAVGVIGLGNMGGPMATHLARDGYSVHGYDVSEDALGRLVAAGGTSTTSPAQAARASSVLFTSLPSEAAFKTVLSAEGGLLEGAHEGLVVVETSTLSIGAKAEAFALLAQRGVTMLDCPLSGTASQMRDKDIAVYASGDSETIARCEAIFAAFSRVVYVVGKFGDGMKLKLIANHLVTLHTAAAAEGLLLVGRSGLDPGRAFEALIDGAGTSRMLEVRGPLMLRQDFSHPNMPIAGYLKDVDLISGFAREVRCPVPLFALCAQLCVAALAQGRSDEDPAAVFSVLKSMAEG